MKLVELQPALRQSRKLGGLLSILLLVTLTPASTLTAENPIVLENQQPGTVVRVCLDLPVRPGGPNWCAREAALCDLVGKTAAPRRSCTKRASRRTRCD
jgi:hypothetical protein